MVRYPGERLTGSPIEHSRSPLGSSGAPGARSLVVVAGLIVVEHHLLVCQRDSRGVFPLKWEFPGGKVESGEAKVDALIRELKEELNIEVSKAREVFSHRHNYSADASVDLTFFHVGAFRGSPENRLFNDMLWVGPGELERLDFLEGDLALIEEIRQGALPLDVSQRVLERG